VPIAGHIFVDDTANIRDKRTQEPALRIRACVKGEGLDLFSCEAWGFLQVDSFEGLLVGLWRCWMVCLLALRGPRAVASLMESSRLGVFCSRRWVAREMARRRSYRM